MTLRANDPGQSAGLRVPRRERLLTLAWSAIENICRQLLSLVFFFLSVHFLHPSDLGLFSVALALSCVAGIVIDEPIGESLVQKADVTTADWDTGFTVNLIIAACFTLLTAAAAWPLSLALGEPGLRFVLPALAGSALVGALGNIQKAFLVRTLRFRVIAQTTLAAQLAGGLASVTLAALGFGYWALVANVAIVAAVMSAIYYAVSPWKPRLRIDRATVASRMPYTIYSAAIRSIYLVRDQSPLIIAGLVLDLTQVGLLSLALRVGRSVSQLFEEVTGRPLLSLMSREQHNLRQFGQTLVEMLAIVGLFAVPAYVGLAVTGPQLIPLVFGADWALAGVYLSWSGMVLAGWLVLHVVVVALRARDLGRIAVALTVPAALIDAVVLTVFMPLGMHWALMAWSVRAMLTLPVAAHVLHNRLGVSLPALAQRLAVPVLASALMALILLSLIHVDALGTGLLGTGSDIVLGSLIYGALVLAAMPSLRGEVLSRLSAYRS